VQINYIFSDNIRILYIYPSMVRYMQIICINWVNYLFILSMTEIIAFSGIPVACYPLSKQIKNHQVYQSTHKICFLRHCIIILKKNHINPSTFIFLMPYKRKARLNTLTCPEADDTFTDLRVNQHYFFYGKYKMYM
jgi:hypothetical protein